MMLVKIECQPDPATCTHQTQDVSTGSIITFSQLHLIRPLEDYLDFQVVDSSNDRFTYNFRICENVVNPCGANDPTPFCQTSSSQQSYSLGQLNTQFILDYPSLDKSRGVLIEYSNGTQCASGRNRRVLITLECDPNSLGPLSAVSAANHQNQDPCEYELYAKSPFACPDVSDNVCSGIRGCSACTLFVGCGWCAAQQKCVRGDPSGPLDGSLCLGSKSYLYGSSAACPDCVSINGCSECNSNPDCKWCEDGGCISYYERECTDVLCTCPSCSRTQYCPADGGDCATLPNEAGLFVGGMFLGFGIVGIAFGGYVFYKKKAGPDYQSLS